MRTRLLAVRALLRMARSGSRAKAAVLAELDEHPVSSRDRAFLWELVNGVLRHRTTIDSILSTFSRMQLAKLEAKVREDLRVAVYQIVWLERVPVSAAVYEAVEIVKKNSSPWVSGFVNGVLRALSRAIDIRVGGVLQPADRRRAVPIGGYRHCLFDRPVLPDPDVDPIGFVATRFSHPQWFVERLIETYGAEATEDVLRAGNEPPAIWLRPRPGRFTHVMRELTGRGIPFEVEREPAPAAIRLLASVGRIDELPGWANGWFVVQDRAAMRPVELLDAAPGETVVDLCAAPGGKTSRICERVGPSGHVIAVDRNPARLARLAENAERLRVTNLAIVAANARRPPFGRSVSFDRALVDAPCSNSGVLSSRVEARKRLTVENVRALADLQDRLLRAALELVKPGGRVVYSTCSILPEENHDVVQRAVDAGLPLSIEEEVLVLPAESYSGGGYCAALARTSDGIPDRQW